MESIQLYNKVREKRGEALVALKAIEEMGELSAVLSKFLGEDETLLPNVQEEIADVLIMMEQLRLIFFPTMVDRKKNEKLVRLERRVNEWPVIAKPLTDVAIYDDCRM